MKKFFGPAAMALLFLIACSNQAIKLPKYAHVPEFQMTDSHGNPFKSSQLTGKVWIADFIYTQCPAECPLMSAKMHRLSKNLDSGIRLISFSVDPEHDTPAALTRFAAHFGAPTPQWTFLTGSPQTVHLLAWSTFHVGDVIGKIEHSTRFILVDRQGNIRGYYSSFDDDSLKNLAKDANALESR